MSQPPTKRVERRSVLVQFPDHSQLNLRRLLIAGRHDQRLIIHCDSNTAARRFRECEEIRNGVHFLLLALSREDFDTVEIRGDGDDAVGAQPRDGGERGGRVSGFESLELEYGLRSGGNRP